MKNSTNNPTSIESNIDLWQSILDKEILNYAKQFDEGKKPSTNAVINASNMLSHYKEKQVKMTQMMREWMEEIKKVEGR